jgi:hypothetical protein
MLRRNNATLDGLDLRESAMLASIIDLLFATGQVASFAGIAWGAVLCLGTKRIDRSHVMPWSSKAATLGMHPA